MNDSYFNQYGNIFENYLETQRREAFLKHCKIHLEPQLIFAAVIIALVVIGLVGNTIVLATILILKEYKKSVTNWYILQLAIADTVFLLMLPFTAHSEIVGRWNFSLTLCRFKEGVIFINYYASIYFLVVMSFDRYLAVTKAFDSNSKATLLRSPRASYIISVFGWILSVIFCIQIYQFSHISPCKQCAYNFMPVETKSNQTDYNGGDVDYHEGLSEYSGDYSSEEYGNYSSGENGNFSGINYDADYYHTILQEKLQNQTLNNSSLSTPVAHQCRTFASKEFKIWVYGNFLGAFVFPFALVCFFYGMIIKTINSGAKVGNANRQNAYRRRVTMIVASLVTLFVVSWLPWYLEKLLKLRGLSLSPTSCKNLSNAVRALAYLNSAFNPYFYSFLGTHFRERLVRASSKVGLTGALQSRSAIANNNKKQKYSTSNSGGSTGGKSNKPPSIHKSGQPPKQGYENKDVQCSLAIKTERTDLVL